MRILVMLKMTICLMIGLFGLAGTPASAHETDPVRAALSVAPEGSLTVSLTLNVEQYITGVDPGHRSTMRGPEGERYKALRQMSPAAFADVIAAGDLLADAVVVTDGAGKEIPFKMISSDIPAVGNTRRARRSTLTMVGPPAFDGPVTISFDERVGDVILTVMPAGKTNGQKIYLPMGEAFGPAALRAAGS